MSFGAGHWLTALGQADETVRVTSEAGTFWLPPNAATNATTHDALFYFIYYLSAFFFVLIVGAMIYFVLKYRRKGDDDKTSPIKGSHKIEIIWSVVPSILLMVMFVWGFAGFVEQAVPPGNSMEIRVTATQWNWAFTHPRGQCQTNNVLVVPVDQPVQLTMSSAQVLHSLYVPAFRVKRDVLPNRYTTLWFEATRLGEYDLFCTEYCGTSHSEMTGIVRVVTQEEYQTWLGSEECIPLAGAGGAALFELRGCTACHAVTETGGSEIGPRLYGMFGTQREMDDGSSVLADDNYLRRAIMDPNAEVRAGFQPVMPTLAGSMTEDQINSIIDYIKSLGNEETGTEE